MKKFVVSLLVLGAVVMSADAASARPWGYYHHGWRHGWHHQHCGWRHHHRWCW